MLSNLVFNIIIPVVILTKFSKPEYLGEIPGLLIALSFPLCFGAYDLWKNKKWNYISVLGLVSVLLTGGLALLKLDGIWFAVKEAAIPLIIGIVVLYSVRKNHFILRALFLNPAMIDASKVEEVIQTEVQKAAFDRLLTRTTQIISSSFFLSAILNFVLARVILQSAAGTVEFNEELGEMTALSYPVIVLPCTVVLTFAIWYLLGGIRKISGIDLFESIQAPKK